MTIATKADKRYCLLYKKQDSFQKQEYVNIFPTLLSQRKEQLFKRGRFFTTPTDLFRQKACGMVVTTIIKGESH